MATVSSPPQQHLDLRQWAADGAQTTGSLPDLDGGGADAAAVSCGKAFRLGLAVRRRQGVAAPSASPTLSLSSGYSPSASAVAGAVAASVAAEDAVPTLGAAAGSWAGYGAGAGYGAAGVVRMGHRYRHRQVRPLRPPGIRRVPNRPQCGDPPSPASASRLSSVLEPAS